MFEEESERTMKMRLNRLGLAGWLLAALLATLALSAIAASAAHAEEAPHWVVSEKSLKGNESRLLAIKAYNGTKEPFTLEGEISSGKVKVECSLVKPAGNGNLIAGEPGTVEFALELSHCTQKGNGVEPCKVHETIETHTLKGELVVNTATGTRSISNLVELGAANGSTKELVALSFSGAGCSVEAVGINDLALGQWNTDPEAGGTKEEATSASTGESSSFLLRFPDQTTQVWLWQSAGKREGFKITPLKFGSLPWSLKGALLISLANGEKFGVKGDPPKCKSKKTKWVVCADEVELLTKTIAKLKSGTMILESVTGGVTIKIECTSTTFTPTLEPGGGMKVTDTFEGCSVSEPHGSCEVEGKKLTTELLSGKLPEASLEKPSVTLEGAFKIASFKLIGCEAFEGTYMLSGSQECGFDSAHEKETLEHTIICEKTESKLKLEGGKFKSETVSLSLSARGPLTGEPDWSIQLN